MIDWDQDGEIEPEDVGYSAMMIDDLEKEDPPRKKKGCFLGCLGTTFLILLLSCVFFWSIAMAL